MKPISFEPYKGRLQAQLDKEFENFLCGKHCSSTATFKVDLTDLFKDIPKAQVIFLEQAYLKMFFLTQRSDKELAAHGVVTRRDNVFIVEDLLMYPQHVTAATVKASDEYGPWLHELPDDTFNRLRFQFHSHVHFGCVPSGTDDDWYKDMLKDVEDFYIFMIFNKRGDKWFNIYDVQNNLIYEDKDVLMSTMVGDTLVQDWLEESFLLIDERTYGQRVNNTGTTYSPTPNPQESLQKKWEEAKAAADAKQGKKKPGRPPGTKNKKHLSLTGLNDDVPPRSYAGVGGSAADDYRGGKVIGNGTSCLYFAEPSAEECQHCNTTYGYYPCEREVFYD